jgi:hypothetical protein
VFALLFAGVGSAVVLLTVAVLVTVPVAAVVTLSTIVNVALVAGFSVAIVHVIGPVPPTAGVVQLNVGPLFCVDDANVVFAGSVSFSATAVAPDGPAFATVTV